MTFRETFDTAGLARDLDDAHQIIRGYADEVDISRDRIDDLAGFPDRFASKLLCDPPIRRMTMLTFWEMLGALELAAAIVKDPKPRGRLSKQTKRPPQPSIHWRHAKRLSMMQKEHVRRGQLGQAARRASMTREQLSAHGRLMANARWTKHRRQMKELQALLNAPKKERSKRGKSRKPVKPGCGVKRKQNQR